MSITGTVPVTISPEAKSFIDRNAQLIEFERMIERARRILPRVRSIEVEIDEATEATAAAVVLWAHRNDTAPASDSTHRDWIDWMAETFPPEVCQNFTLLSVHHDNGR
jgi:hypothetical protein